MKTGRKPIGEKAKTVQVTLRIQPKTKYALDLVASQLEGGGITKFVEAAIASSAKKLELAGREWTDLWDEHEGVRKLNELGCRGYKQSDADEVLAEFVEAHRSYFWADSAGTIPKRANVEALWPKMQHYLHAWRSGRGENPKAAAKMMDAALKNPVSTMKPIDSKKMVDAALKKAAKK